MTSFTHKLQQKYCVPLQVVVQTAKRYPSQNQQTPPACDDSVYCALLAQLQPDTEYYSNHSIDTYHAVLHQY